MSTGSRPAGGSPGRPSKRPALGSIRSRITRSGSCRRWSASARRHRGRRSPRSPPSRVKGEEPTISGSSSRRRGCASWVRSLRCVGGPGGPERKRGVRSRAQWGRPVARTSAETACELGRERATIHACDWALGQPTTMADRVDLVDRDEGGSAPPSPSRRIGHPARQWRPSPTRPLAILLADPASTGPQVGPGIPATRDGTGGPSWPAANREATAPCSRPLARSQVSLLPRTPANPDQDGSSPGAAPRRPSPGPSRHGRSGRWIPERHRPFGGAGGAGDGAGPPGGAGR